jgi:hypothetical protein
MRRVGTLGALVVVVGVVAPSATWASDGSQVVGASDATARKCDAQPLPERAPGVSTTSWNAPARGLLTVKLEGSLAPGSDWDLAAFKSSSQSAWASTSFGSAEQVTLWVEEGERVDIQACRRTGGDPSVPLTIDLHEMAPPEPDSERISLEAVPISGPEDVIRLEALGFDVTHEVSPFSATLVLYTDAERAMLAAAGFTSHTLVSDLVAADAADRAREARARAAPGRSDLPTGREEYRVYEDYTTEMKQLAEANPDLVRPVVIGSTFEDRPIEGIEIAADVNSVSDGRPVYLQMGLHHAREWPSGELPMEFAHDLVAGYGNSPRITDLLDRVRVFVFPVINVDGFIASRSFGTSPTDDDPDATLPLALNDQAAYKRKNCRPTVPGSEAVPCADRIGSGVDLNRNYGAYWGGPGSSSMVNAQSYRGTEPYSEPESEAVHQFTATIHPTVFITNHTFTEDGKWLRQPGFDDVITVAPEPDETNMKNLGDAMAAATGWTSELGYETLGDITGATEDWNYFAQGTYGYTPEARGPNFHANYANMVVTEYLGDATHPGLGVREAFLVAGEAAGDPALHSLIEGSAPPGATLRLTKEFDTPTCGPPGDTDTDCDPPGSIHDVLDTTLTVPSSGQYSWHVNPSSRPLVPGEVWTMSCQFPGGQESSTTVAVARGETVGVDWIGACETAEVSPPEPGASGAPSCKGKAATVVGSAGGSPLVGTPGRDVIVGFDGDDEVRAKGGRDLICVAGGADEVRGGGRADTVVGGDGDDELRGNGGRDRLLGGDGDDLLVGGAGKDRCRGGPGEDRAPGCS